MFPLSGYNTEFLYICTTRTTRHTRHTRSTSSTRLRSLAAHAARLGSGAFVRIMLLILISLSSAGCLLTDVSCHNMASGVNEFVPVASLPGLLEMRSERISGWSASMSDPMNTLLILSRPQYQVMLNGKEMSCAGEVCHSGGRLMVRRSLVARLRQSMRDQQSTPSALTLAALTVATSANTGPFSAVIAIDAGHGGKDPGSMAGSGPPEKVLALDIAKQVAANLRQRNIKVVMTREDDTFIELNERAAIANRARADLFVSVHLDSNPSSAMRGHTLYIARKASAASRRLAGAIDSSLQNLTPGRHGIRGQNFRVLVKTDMPAVLVETGFLSNTQDRRMLNTVDYRKKAARSIADGIMKYLAAN